MAAKIDRFSVPPLFEEISFLEQKCPLSLHDANKSSKEMWLIRAPSQFDGSLLNGVTLNLDGESVEFSAADMEEKSYTYEAVSMRKLQENVMQSPYLLLPSAEDKSLGPAQSFKGQITIMESLNLPPLNRLPDIVASTAPKMPKGLRQRFNPYGCEEPWQRRDQLSSTEVPLPPSRKKKKKKTRLEESQDEGNVGETSETSGVLALDIDKMDNDDDNGGMDLPDGQSEIWRKEETRRKAKRKHTNEEVTEAGSVPESEEPSTREDLAERPKKKKKKKKSKE